MSRLIMLLAILAAASARAWLHFSTPMVQGMNGAYYLVQARSLIEKFSLAIPDLPLTFSLHALLASLIHGLSALDVDHSVMLAVKLADSCLPALVVIPVMLLGRAWTQGNTTDTLITALAGVLIAAGAPALLMVGDFEKNSLGLALMCTLAWALHRWMESHTTRRIILAAGLIGLIGLTHIGVFGTTLLFAGGTLAGLTVAQGKEGMARVGRILLFAGPFVAIAAGLVFWKFDPARIQKLLHAFSDPSDYLSNQGGPPGMAPGQGPGRGAGPMTMPGMNDGFMRWAPTIAFFIVALVPLAIVWTKRKTIGLQNLAIITGAALTVIALTGPWVQGDKMMRFQLNAVPLAILCLLFALLQIPRPLLRGVPALLLLVGALIPSAIKIADGPRPIITPQTHKELQSLAQSVEDPKHTLIAAHHGLEWWTAWVLHTSISQPQALKPDDWKKYKYVWYLEQKGGMGMPPMAGGLFGGPPSMAKGPRQGMPNRERGRERFDGPPPGMMMGNGPGGRGGRGGPMAGPQIPNDAEILHEGENFKLGWVKTPPANLTPREPNPLSIFDQSPLGDLQ